MMSLKTSDELSETKRLKTLRNARIAVWVCPLALQLMVVGFVLMLRHHHYRLDFETALNLLLPIVGVAYFTGAWYQAVQTVRRQGIESRNGLVTTGSILSLIVTILIQSYHDKIWALFSATASILVLVVTGGLVAGCDSWNKRRKQNAA